jgi:hypothetical protein
VWQTLIFSNPEKKIKSNKSLYNLNKDEELGLINKTPKSSTVVRSSILLNEKEKSIHNNVLKNNQEINFATNNPMIHELISNKSEKLNNKLNGEIESPLKLSEKDPKCDPDHDIIDLRLDNIFKNIISKENKKVRFDKKN